MKSLLIARLFLFVCCFWSKEIVKMSSAYTTLTIGDKADIIDLLETRSPASLAGEYNVSVSTIYQIRAKKKEILEAAKRSLIHKRIVETKYPVVEQFLPEWVEQARMKNLIISDDILQTQVLQFAREQHMDNFKASEKWVLGFKKMGSGPFLSRVRLPLWIVQLWKSTKRNFRTC